MKKILFYIAFVLCLIQAIFWLCFPFMGPLTIAKIISDGLFGSKLVREVAVHNARFGWWTQLFNFLDSFITAIYFISIFSGSILPTFYRLNWHLKYRLGIMFFLTSAFTLLAGKLFNILLY